MTPTGGTRDAGYVRVAAAVPPVKVADVGFNLERIVEYAGLADAGGAQLTVFPELSLTGYTTADLLQHGLLIEAARRALEDLAAASARIRTALVVGLPVAIDHVLVNAAAVVSAGCIRGLVPKSYIPGSKEYYEQRWFAPARHLTARETTVGGGRVPIGTDLLFGGGPGLPVFGVEICEDLWGPLPPSSVQVVRGAQFVANLSASNELVGKADYRRALVAQQSARGICGYVYASCGVHESTTDVVFGGHALVAENGLVLAESRRFVRGGELVVADVDLDHLAVDRLQVTAFRDAVHALPPERPRLVEAGLPRWPGGRLRREIDPTPFVPRDDRERDRRTEEVFAIQCAGLAKRVEQARIARLIVGLSGGLDSTLALLVSLAAANSLGLGPASVLAITMPGFGTSARTRDQARRLAEACGVALETIDITAGCRQMFADIGHDRALEDVTFENVQARYRTMILLNRANQMKGLVVGTGDLSEIALGWATFGGDHLSHYHVNAGVPKTLVRHLVAWAASRPDVAAAAPVLGDILATPISPELVGDGRTVTQQTEEIIGPYELHDFFLYHFARWQSPPSKIAALAVAAFEGRYDAATIRRWLRVFITRFFASQWKRSVMPDGPKVGSVALSPRGDWRMPSDGEAALWLRDLDESAGGEPTA